MQRRNFLQLAMSMAATRVVPVAFGVTALANKAFAANPIYSNVNVTAPAVMPQVINIFMYGGASELAGNISNIADINLNSVNDYSANNAFGAGILQTVADDPVNGQITLNGCWKDAGGAHMEDMLASGDMTLYRTLYKQKNPTRSHRDSIFMSQKGTTDIEGAPGIGSRLALMLKQNESAYASARFADDTTVAGEGGIEALTLPFVSFEGESQTFALDPLQSIPLQLRGLTMDQNLNNPFTRGGQGSSEDAIQSMVQDRLAILQANRAKYSKAMDGFEKREEMEGRMADLQGVLNGTDDNGNQSSADLLGVTYPNTSFGRQLESAITLAIHNPQTLYVAVGTPGLGGWDDHNNGIDQYRNRMDDLMDAIKSGVAHINAAGEQGVTTISETARTRTDNIIINVFGDFGRLVNLNNSGGWDHANNQNLYTFGGAGVRPTKEKAAMGTVVGQTFRDGTSKTNNQYTVPDIAGGSPTFEPMSVAASIYGYFGATNPGVLTSNDIRLEDGL